MDWFDALGALSDAPDDASTSSSSALAAAKMCFILSFIAGRPLKELGFDWGDDKNPSVVAIGRWLQLQV